LGAVTCERVEAHAEAQVGLRDARRVDELDDLHVGSLEIVYAAVRTVFAVGSKEEGREEGRLQLGDRCLPLWQRGHQHERAVRCRHVAHVQVGPFGQRPPLGKGKGYVCNRVIVAPHGVQNGARFIQRIATDTLDA
jgi:hypothetical protein